MDKSESNIIMSEYIKYRGMLARRGTDKENAWIDYQRAFALLTVIYMLGLITDTELSDQKKKLGELLSKVTGEKI